MIDPISDQMIANRAYELWVLRGCPDGSPDVDWLQAEHELQSHNGGTLAADSQRASVSA